MTTTTSATARHRSALYWTFSDVRTLANRNLIALFRTPTLVVFAIIQPIMFVLLFRYVFGGAIHITGTTYVNYLIPGILVQTVIFGSVNTAIGLAEDLHKGLIERFKALPMARMAVLGGRTLADMLRSVVVLFIITGVGFLVGFRPDGGFIPYIEACLVMLAFAYSLSWGFAFIGLAAPSAEAAQAMTFPLIFPLVFASVIFVQLSSLPWWLQGFANNQPISQATYAVRGLMLGQAHGNSVWISLAWSVGLIAFLAPLAVNRFRKAA
jgi:ABC-2 type transport system permease protein/oleandomycin transport system permease protein